MVVQIVGQSSQLYQLEPTPFAQGGQAKVFAGQDAAGQPVAVKIALDHPSSRRAVSREIELLSWLQEKAPGVGVGVLDAAEWDGAPALVMPRYPGHADRYVTEVLPRGDGLDLERILTFVGQLVENVSRLHALTSPNGGQLVHRDLKPENVLVNARGAPVLADLAGSTEVHPLREVRESAVGTPLWTPYEQLLAEKPPANPTWDSYACCVMLFWWMTGARPSYQDDPSPMLTPIGRKVRDALLHAATQTDRADAIAAWQQLRRIRDGVPPADLIDPRGHGAIQPEDEQTLSLGVHRLGSARVYGASALEECARGLSGILARGLSPLSYPSPPNRYWETAELLRDLVAIRKRLINARLRRQRRRAMWWAVLMGACTAVVFIVAAMLAVPRRASQPVVEVSRAARIEGGTLMVAGEPRTVLPFQLDRFEVRTDDYLSCVDAGGCTAPVWMDDTKPHVAYALLKKSEQPIVGVSWSQADRYCHEQGGRLPSAEEWAFAATQGGTTKWPWGDAPVNCERANLKPCGLLQTLPVDALSAGDSPEGVRNLIGNAYEWTGTSIETRSGVFRRKRVSRPVLMGGAFDVTAEDARPDEWPTLSASGFGVDLSFRCAYSLSTAGRGE